jgi:carbamoyltransferase
MRVLGIHDGHTASACLVEDGKIKFAIQEERLVYEKNKSGFPGNSIKKIMEKFNLKPDDIDKVAFASLHNSPQFATGEYFSKHVTRSRFRHQIENLAVRTPFYSTYKAKRKEERIKQAEEIGFSSDKIEFVEHHLCHAATAYFGSHFSRNDKVLVLTNDGAGDGLCATVSIGQGNELKRLAEVKSDDTLAGIYGHVTKMMGFKPLEHEYKLMGMAPYCSPKGEAQGYEIFKDLISMSAENPLIFKRGRSEPIGMIMPLLLKRSRYVRFDSICAGLQKFTEERLVEWVSSCVRETGVRKVALAGGIFMNVKANKRIMEIPELEELFVFPSCADETISIGAAYEVYNHLKSGKDPEIEPLEHFYLGDDFSDENVMEAIKNFEKSNVNEEDKFKRIRFKYKQSRNMNREVAMLLAEKEVVAICRGRMEFGARALGNRSILADPSDMNCVREINMMIKNRDFWMPFAPVILEEREKDYIVNEKGISAPYMIMTFDSTENYPEMIAAVQQADLTARPQVINSKMNKDYYMILREFEKLTGRGVLLNTSFNLHGYPIVHGPKEALEVFRDSGLKYLVLGGYLVEKI